MPSIDIPATSGIYKISFLDPDCFYIGSAVNLRRRYQRHLNDLRKGVHTNPHLQNAYTKYGMDTLHFEIVEFVQREDLVKREQYYLDLKPHYNICEVAFIPPRPVFSLETRAKLSAKLMGNSRTKDIVPPNKGKPLSKEQKSKMSISLKGRSVWNKGKIYSAEERAKMSTDQRGKKHSDATKAKISASEKGRPSPYKGKHHSEETRSRISASNKGMTFSPEAIAKRVVTRAANKAKKHSERQSSLWNDVLSG